MGYEAKLKVYDISKEMLIKVYNWEIYDDLFIQDVNKGFLLFENSIDLIINVGFNGIIKYS